LPPPPPPPPKRTQVLGSNCRCGSSCSLAETMHAHQREVLDASVPGPQLTHMPPSTKKQPGWHASLRCPSCAHTTHTGAACEMLRCQRANTLRFLGADA
jgi:hypothetical protein